MFPTTPYNQRPKHPFCPRPRHRILQQIPYQTQSTPKSISPRTHAPNLPHNPPRRLKRQWPRDLLQQQEWRHWSKFFTPDLCFTIKIIGCLVCTVVINKVVKKKKKKGKFNTLDFAVSFKWYIMIIKIKDSLGYVLQLKQLLLLNRLNCQSSL
jgi:hypothetical protein